MQDRDVKGMRKGESEAYQKEMRPHQTKTATIKEKREMAARMFKPQRLGDDKMYKLPFFYYMLFILFSCNEIYV